MTTCNVKFSITIPAYKGKFLAEAIESCICQTYPDFEVIIVDDASPEGLRAIAETYLTDPRIKFFRNEKNCGALNVVDNWNICLKHATGDYVICMGDDDRLVPSCLEEYARLLSAYPGIGALHAWTEIIDENGDFVRITAKRPEHESVYSVIWHRWNGRDDQFIGDWCFKRDLLIRNGGYFKLPLAWGSDDISAVIAATPFGVANTQCVAFQYRINRNTITNSGNYDIKRTAVYEEETWYRQFLACKPKDMYDIKYWESIANCIDNHYRLAHKSLIATEIRKHPYRLFTWLFREQFYKCFILK